MNLMKNVAGSTTAYNPIFGWLQPTSTTTLTSKGHSRLNPVLGVVDGLAVD